MPLVLTFPDDASRRRFLDRAWAERPDIAGAMAPLSCAPGLLARTASDAQDLWVRRAAEGVGNVRDGLRGGPG